MIKEKLASVDGHTKSSMHPAKSINTPPVVFIPAPAPEVIQPAHPDLGTYPNWHERNPNWSGITGQTSFVPLQTTLVPPTKQHSIKQHSTGVLFPTLPNVSNLNW